jgi:hypothetical protein
MDSRGRGYTALRSMSVNIESFLCQSRNSLLRVEVGNPENDSDDGYNDPTKCLRELHASIRAGC